MYLPPTSQISKLQGSQCIAILREYNTKGGVGGDVHIYIHVYVFNNPPPTHPNFINLHPHLILQLLLSEW